MRAKRSIKLSPRSATQSSALIEVVRALAASSTECSNLLFGTPVGTLTFVHSENYIRSADIRGLARERRSSSDRSTASASARLDKADYPFPAAREGAISDRAFDRVSCGHTPRRQAITPLPSTTRCARGAEQRSARGSPRPNPGPFGRASFGRVQQACGLATARNTRANNFWPPP